MSHPPIEIPNCFYRISIKALIIESDGRFLLIQEDNGLWELPGGGLDHGEKPHDCIRRELREEMGLETLDIEPSPSYFISVYDNKWRANVIYHTRVRDLNFTPSEECQAIRFFTAEEALNEKCFSNVYEFARMYSHSLGNQ